MVFSLNACALVKNPQPNDWQTLQRATRSGRESSLRHLQLRGVGVRMDRFLHGERDPQAVLSTMFMNLKTLVLTGVLMLDAEQIKVLLASADLEEVTLDGLRMSGDGTFYSEAVQPLVNLRALHLPNAAGLPKLELRNTKLEILELRGCASLAETSLDLPSLLCLDLSYTAVSGEAVEEAITSCANLRSLFIQGCNRIEAVCVMSPSLTVVDASTCSSMRRFRVVGEQVHLLQLDLCVALEGLILDVPAVRKLDLSMLPMNQLHIKARKLKKLNLNGCSLLRDVQADCPRLQCLFAACSPAPVEVFGLQSNVVQWKRS